MYPVRGAARRARTPILCAGGAIPVCVILFTVAGRTGRGAVTQSGGMPLLPTAEPMVPETVSPDAAVSPPQPTSAVRPTAALAAPACVTGAPAAGATTAPALLLSDGPQARRAPSIVTASAGRPAVPAALPVTAAPTPSTPPAAPVTANPALPAADAPSLLANGWTERPGSAKNPEVIVHNSSGRAALLLLGGSRRDYRWAIPPEGARFSLVPGTYRYELREQTFERTGRPDEMGTLTFGRYRTYEGECFHREGSETRTQHLGDR